MHSSRMRTVRGSGHFWGVGGGGGVCLGVCLPRGGRVYARGDACPGEGGCLPRGCLPERGVFPGTGCLPGGRVSALGGGVSV